MLTDTEKAALDIAVACSELQQPNATNSEKDAAASALEIERVCGT